MRKSVISKLLLIVIALLLAACLLQSCTDKAYKIVAVDPAPKLKNKALLLMAYNRSFPQQTNHKVKSDTTKSVQIDTAKNNSIETTADAINKYLLAHPCNIDTAVIVAIVKAGIKPDVIKTHTQTTIHDSIPYEDREQLNALQLSNENLKHENVSLIIENAELKNTVEITQARIHKIQNKAALIAAILVFAGFAAIAIKFYK